MAKERNLRIGPYLLAAVLLGAPAMQASFAQEQSSAHDAAGSGPSAAPDGSRPASGDDKSQGGAKSEDHAPAEIGAGIKAQDNAGAKEQAGKQELKASAAGPQGAGVKVPKGEGAGAGAKDVDSIESRARDLNEIDTWITMHSRRPGSRLDKAREVKPILKIGSLGNLHVRRAPAPGASNFVARNAIGLSVARHEVIQGPNGERFNFRPPAQSPAAAASGTGSFAAANRGLGGTRIVGQNSSPTVTALSRGRIDGALLIRPGLAPSGVGGPAKVVAGINGTTFRPKH
ncbi:MAG: hypothetical protein ABSC37_17925 [Xanthobacteraceae bacterium]|jgi:hypothetical protein